MKAAEIREMTDEELDRKEADLREELFNLRFQHAMGKLENTARLKALKRDIARILTVKRSRIAEEG